MLHFIVESDREVSIDALGTLTPGEPIELTSDQLVLFKTLHGVELVKANFPSFVSVTAVSSEEV